MNMEGGHTMFQILGRARLVKLKTDDGLFEVRDEVPLGKMYDVWLDSKKVVEGKNTVKNIFWKREVIWVSNFRWIPTELLEIQ